MRGLPAKPADYDDFAKKLAALQNSMHGKHVKLLDRKAPTNTNTTLVKRPAENVDGPSKRTPPPACQLPGSTPKIQVQSSFYKKPCNAPASLARATRTPVTDYQGKGAEGLLKQLPLPPAEVESPITIAAKESNSTPLVAAEEPACVDNAAEGEQDPEAKASGGGYAALVTDAGRADSIDAFRLRWGNGAPPRAEFKLQQQAFEFLDRHPPQLSQQLRVFGAELSGDGKRRFLVTTPARLWSDDVESAEPGSCHLYEIIRQGALCHLYFDLEYVPELNPGVCGDSLVDLLVELLAEELRNTFNIRMPSRSQQQQQEVEEPQRQQRVGAAAGGEPTAVQQDGTARTESSPASSRREREQVSGESRELGQERGPEPGQGQATEPDRGQEPEPGQGAVATTTYVRAVGDSPRGGGGGEGKGACARRGAEPAGGSGAGLGECPWVWELCSTTPAKFSRHLIVRIPHCAFKDNFHVNAFVRRLFDRIAADPVRFQSFFVRRSANPEDPPGLFIDPAVYTRNRAFRLYLSSKAGKTAVLRATRRYAVGVLLRRLGLVRAAPLPPPAIPTFAAGAARNGASDAGVLVPAEVEMCIVREVFLATMVTAVGRVDRVLTVYDDAGGGHGGGGGGDGAAGLVRFHEAEAAAAAPAAAAALGIPRLPLPGGACRGGGAGDRPGHGRPLGAGSVAGGGAWTGDAFRYGPSPFPEVEEFIESMCREGGVQGRVRCWQYMQASGTLLLSMRDNRWCANVGRPHRSNGIYYMVDFKAGDWCQRCHDPDCRDYRSARMPLPPELWRVCQPRATTPSAQLDAQTRAPPAPAHQGLTMEEVRDGQLPQRATEPPRPTMEPCPAPGDEDDPEYDMLCLQALERFEREMEGRG